MRSGRHFLVNAFLNVFYYTKKNQPSSNFFRPTFLMFFLVSPENFSYPCKNSSASFFCRAVVLFLFYVLQKRVSTVIRLLLLAASTAVMGLYASHSFLARSCICESGSTPELLSGRDRECAAQSAPVYRASARLPSL